MTLAATSLSPTPAFDPLVPSVFHSPWWLEIVTNGKYAMAEVKENGKPVARLPYFLRNRAGFHYSIMPPMTHFLGPAIVENQAGAATKMLRRNLLTRELIAQLPKASLYQYKCHRDITDVIAFQQECFETSVQFTYEIAPQPEENLWKMMRSEKRKKIRRAGDEVRLEEMYDPEEFWHFYDRNIQQRRVKNLCERHVVTRLIEAAMHHGQGRVQAARDKTGALSAALFCIWDQTSSYYYMSTRDMSSHNNAISLLTWEAMKEASGRGLIFDFDGLNNANSVLFFTEFGGAVSPRYIVTRHSAFGKAALALRNIRRENRYFF